ncbi:MAG: D-aminoacyl-tRNA deacylase [Bacteroidota bacterium]
MRVVIQRVKEASVEINQKINGKIGVGLLIFVGIENEDTSEDIEWISGKVLNLRIFNDEEGVMNKSLLDISGELLLISQFTLHASTKKGNRPSYLKAAKPDVAIPLYEALIREMESILERSIQTGEFGADMKVNLLNDGPVTILMDTKNKE